MPKSESKANKLWNRDVNRLNCARTNQNLSQILIDFGKVNCAEISASLTKRKLFGTRVNKTTVEWSLRNQAASQIQ